MRRYEVTFIIDPDISEDKRGQIFDKTKTLIEKDDGLIIDFDEWGQKKLAYEIRKKARGYYVCMNLCGSPALIDELERSFRLDDKVLKYMTILLDKMVNEDDIKAEIDSKTQEKSAEKQEDNTPKAEDTSDDKKDVEETKEISEEEGV